MHGVTDYTMARRSVLNELRSGVLSRADVCDAQPELLRVAKHQGTPSEGACPVCESDGCVVVAFAFGERLARRNGRMVETREIPEYVAIDGVRCYSVEVCTECSWNHILQAFLGTDADQIADPAELARDDLEAVHPSGVEIDVSRPENTSPRTASSDQPFIE